MQTQTFKPITQKSLLKIFDLISQYDKETGTESEFYSKNPRKNAKLRSDYKKDIANLPKEAV